MTGETNGAASRFAVAAVHHCAEAHLVYSIFYVIGVVVVALLVLSLLGVT